MRRFKVLKECIVNHDYYEPGDNLLIEDRDEEKLFVKNLITHGFIDEHIKRREPKTICERAFELDNGDILKIKITREVMLEE